MITFPVDPVEPASGRLPTVPWRERAGGIAQSGGERATVDPGGVHPLLGAVHLAFAEHRPLVLGPEAVWLTIGQGVALHANLHADTFRDFLVRHAGRKELSVRGDAGWPERLLRLGEALSGEVGPGWGRLFGCGFSTSTVEDEIAAAVVLLDTFSSFYDFVWVCICGIPEITLLGTPDDWRRIRERVEILPELGLERWASSLRPIADQLVATASGQVDTAFWQQIYKPREAYGGAQIAGWIGRLFPYVGSTGRFDQPNPMLDVPHEALLARPPDRTIGIGSITTASVPSGPSSVTVTVEALDGSRAPFTVEGGLVAVEQDDAGRLVPFAGFVVRPGERALHAVAALARRIVAEHETEPPDPGDPPGGSAAYGVLFGAFRSATLRFGAGPWRILPHADGVRVRPIGDWSPMLSAAIALPDGRQIASGRWTVVLPAAFAEPDPEAAAMLAAIREQWDDGLLLESEVRLKQRDLVYQHPLLDGGVPVLRGTLIDVLAHALDTDGGLDVVDELGALWARLARR